MPVDTANKDVTESDQQARGIPADARVRFQLLEDCREAVVVTLCAVVAEALSKMGDEMSALALKTAQREDQQVLLEAVSVVRHSRSDIEQRFRKAFVDCFERRLFQKNTDEKSENEFGGELKLMDDAMISDKLTVDRLVHKTRARLDPDEVLGIRARLAALLERDWFEETQHPVSPEAVFEALKSSLSDTSPRPEIQTVLLDAFEPHVSANLNQVYVAVNERLKARNILPKIKQQVSSVGSSNRRSGDSAAPGSSGDSAAGSGHSASGGTSSGSGGYAGSGGGGASVSGAAAGAPALDANAQAELISALNLSMQQLAQGIPAARASVTRMLSNPETFGVADLPLPVVQPSLIQSIAQLQIAAAQSRIADPQVITDIVERARDSGSPLDQLTVDFVTMVFDYIQADKRLSETIKQQLLRLQVIAVKAALLDRSFFARRQHPMRRMIDRVVEIGSDPDVDLAPDGPVAQALEDLIDGLLQNFDSDLQAFEQAISQIEALMQSETERRDTRLTEITRKAEQIEARVSAREEAKAMLGERIDESTPVFVKLFLETYWSDAIATAGLSLPGSELSTADCLKVAEALIWSVVPKVPSEIPKLASLLPKLITGLMRGLKPVDIPKADREAFFNELLRVHTASIDSAKQVKPVQTVAARGVSRVRMRSDGSIMYTPPRAVDAKPKVAANPSAQLSRAVAQVRRGDQIEVIDNGEVKEYKLAWVSPSQRLYILSRHPDEARSLDADQFAALFSSGNARVIEPRSSVDQAIDQINNEESEESLAQ